MIFELVRDFADVLDAMPSEHFRYRILRLLNEAIRRDIHFIHRHREDYPQALFQCLWNSGWWYDCPEAAQHYTRLQREQLTADSRPNWDDAGAKLYELVKRWHEQKQQSTLGFRWVRSLRPPSVHLGTAQLAVLRGHENDVLSVSYSPDGSRIASGSRDNTVRIWDVASSTELAVLRGHEDSVTSVSYSPDGSRIVSGSTDKTVRVWDAASGAELAVLRGHEGPVNGVSFSSDG